MLIREEAVISNAQYTMLHCVQVMVMMRKADGHMNMCQEQVMMRKAGPEG